MIIFATEIYQTIIATMDTTKTIKARSKEEILTWLQQARERKQAFQHRVNEEWKSRQLSKKAASESGYYDLEWV
ncbi:MAG: hypothetical protein IJ633_02240 [Prevotella sp.]|nr:hypothetical protein [Prevotella sp.]